MSPGNVTNFSYLDSLLARPLREACLYFEIENSNTKWSVPISWELAIRDFEIYYPGNIQEDSDLRPLTQLDFGEVNMSDNGQIKFMVHNPNTFELPLFINMEEPVSLSF
jgi:hypothetical protein